MIDRSPRSTEDIADALINEAYRVLRMILGQQNLNQASPTYGCFGRRYWSWKATPFPDSTNQFAIYFLALFYNYHRDRLTPAEAAHTITAITAGLTFWCDAQKKDGSFDQVLLNEHGFGPTAYSLYGVLCTIELLKDSLPSALVDRLGSHVDRAAEFLIENDETYGTIANHSALFALVFYKLWNRDRKDVFRERAHRELGLIARTSSSEGWFMEYHGADPGYQTQCLQYLSLLPFSEYPEVEPLIEQAVTAFMPYFIHPDGSVGGFYGSRSTKIVYPAGFALNIPHHPIARSCLEAILNGLKSESVPSPADLDFENSFRVATSYLLAANACSKIDDACELPLLPCERSHVYKVFPEAGLSVYGFQAYYAVVSHKKGGALSVYDKKQRELLLDDRGFLVHVRGQLASSSGNKGHSEFSNKDKVQTLNDFTLVKNEQMTPAKFLILMVLGFTAFHFKFLLNKLKEQLARRLITGIKSVGGQLKRTILFAPDKIVVDDEVSLPKGSEISTTLRTSTTQPIHMASCDFYSPPAKVGDLNLISETQQINDRTLKSSYIITFR